MNTVVANQRTIKKARTSRQAKEDSVPESGKRPIMIGKDSYLGYPGEAWLIKIPNGAIPGAKEACDEAYRRYPKLGRSAFATVLKADTLLPHVASASERFASKDGWRVAALLALALRHGLYKNGAEFTHRAGHIFIVALHQDRFPNTGEPYRTNFLRWRTSVMRELRQYARGVQS